MVWGKEKLHRRCLGMLNPSVQKGMWAQLYRICICSTGSALVLWMAPISSDNSMYLSVKQHSPNFLTLIVWPHLPGVQTPVLKRIYTRAHFLNLCHLDLCDHSGADVKEKGRKRHTELSEGNAVWYEKHARAFARKQAPTHPTNLSRTNQGSKVKWVKSGYEDELRWHHLGP